MEDDSIPLPICQSWMSSNSADTSNPVILFRWSSVGADNPFSSNFAQIVVTDE